MIMGELKHYEYFSGLSKNFMASLKFFAENENNNCEMKVESKIYD